MTQSEALGVLMQYPNEWVSSNKIAEMTGRPKISSSLARLRKCTYIKFKRVHRTDTYAPAVYHYMYIEND